MSIPSFEHGRSRMTCGISGSQGLAGLYLAHMEPLDFVSSMSRPILGQYIMKRSLALHFSMPKWLSCRLVNISWRKLGGMTRDSPLNTRPSIMWSSSHSGQYCRVQVEVSLLYAAHPLMMRVFTICRHHLQLLLVSESSFCHWKVEGRKPDCVFSAPFPQCGCLQLEVRMAGVPGIACQRCTPWCLGHSAG